MLSFSRVWLFVTPWTVALLRQEYWSGLPCPPPGTLLNPGIEPRSPALQADSLLSEPPGKPKNTGVGSLSLLQRIYPTQELNLSLTQELNQGLLHCRRILYQLSYQGGSENEKLGCLFINSLSLADDWERNSQEFLPCPPPRLAHRSSLFPEARKKP